MLNKKKSSSFAKSRKPRAALTVDLVSDSQRRWMHLRLQEIHRFYIKRLQAGSVARSDLGYLSLFFRLSADVLSDPTLKKTALQVRDLAAEVSNLKIDQKNTHILLNPWSNRIALKIWEEMGEPTKQASITSLLPPKTQDKALFIGAVGYGLTGSVLGNNTATLACIKTLKKKIASLGPLSGYPLKNDIDETVLDLGMAHGDAGILSFASQEKIYTVADKLADSFVEIGSILKNRPFPHYISKKILTALKNPRFTDYYSRMAWCYGDAGVGFSLLTYSQMDNAQLSKEAFALSNKLLDRALDSAAKNFGSLDPFFCHGRSGLLQIALRRHQLLQSARTKKTVHQLIPTLKYSNTQFFSNRLTGGHLLEGYLGYGLVLMSLLNPQDFAWDRIFLLSRLHD